MSDISTINNRVIPVDVELYTREQEEFPDINVVGKNDSEYKIQFTLKNKNAASPYAVAVSDVSGADKVEILLISPSGTPHLKPTSFGTDGSDGIIFTTIGEAEMNFRGTWRVYALVTYGDIVVTYPRVPFLVE